MEKFIDYLQNFSEIVPIEWFVFFGGIIEEVLAPIPSPVIMTFAGSTLATSEASYLYLVLIGSLGAFGKTIGSLILYGIGYFMEEVFIEKYGSYFGLSKKLFNEYSLKINNLKFGMLWISFLRAMPFIPSAPFSGIFGILKYDVKTFFFGSLIGNIIRDTFYVFVGFYSFQNIDAILGGFESIDKFISLGSIAFIVFLLYKLRKFYIKKHF